MSVGIKKKKVPIFKEDISPLVGLYPNPVITRAVEEIPV